MNYKFEDYFVEHAIQIKFYELKVGDLFIYRPYTDRQKRNLGFLLEDDIEEVEDLKVDTSLTFFAQLAQFKAQQKAVKKVKKRRWQKEWDLVSAVYKKVEAKKVEDYWHSKGGFNHGYRYPQGCKWAGQPVISDKLIPFIYVIQVDELKK